MPLGIVEDSEFDVELNRLDKPQDEPRAIIVDKAVPGRSDGDMNVPKGLRKIIGEEGLVNGRASAIGLAKSFGVSHDSADAYRNGANSLATYNQPDQALSSHLDNIKKGIAAKATGKLDAALESITPEKLEDVKPRDAAGIAKDMSVIVKNMEPEKKESGTRIGPNFIFYAPHSRSEDEYEILQVDE